MNPNKHWCSVANITLLILANKIRGQCLTNTDNSNIMHMPSGKADDQKIQTSMAFLLAQLLMPPMNRAYTLHPLFRDTAWN